MRVRLIPERRKVKCALKTGGSVEGQENAFAKDVITWLKAVACLRRKAGGGGMYCNWCSEFELFPGTSDKFVSDLLTC